LQPYYRRLGFEQGSFPCSEAYAESAISLPLFPGLRDNDIQFVAQLLRDIINGDYF